jgi:hypothetical protein
MNVTLGVGEFLGDPEGSAIWGLMAAIYRADLVDQVPERGAGFSRQAYTL